MSFFDYRALRPVNDPTIKTYPWVLDLDSTTDLVFDSIARLSAVWHKALLRNYSTFAMSYRFSPGEQFNTLPAMGERALNGWGSYIEIKSTAIPAGQKYGLIEFEMTPLAEAWQQ